jgi:hypothetical protein
MPAALAWVTHQKIPAVRLTTEMDLSADAPYLSRLQRSIFSPMMRGAGWRFHFHGLIFYFLALP